MKSAEDWVYDLTDLECIAESKEGHFLTSDKKIEFIHQVQRDALLHASEMFEAVLDSYAAFRPIRVMELRDFLKCAQTTKPLS